MATRVIMPQLGESVVEGTVSRWLKKVGDPVREFEPILEVSTDKVDTEVPSPAEGIILAIYVPEGTTVERGVLLAVVGQPGEGVPDAPGEGSAVHGGGHAMPVVAGTAAQPAQVMAATAVAEKTQRFSPVVARMAAEYSLDLTRIKGTGMNGRVTKKDVEAFLETREISQVKLEDLPPWEQPISGDLFKPTDEIFAKASGQTGNQAMLPTTANTASAQASAVQPVVSRQVAAAAPVPQETPGELFPLSAMRRAIADHMVRSKLQTAPHVTTVFEVDMTRTMAHWKANEEAFAKQGVRLTLTAYFVAAMVKAAQAQPILNAQWTDNGIFVHSAINVGMAVALQEGLIVPVIKHAQDLNLMGLARQVTDLATRARNKALKADEVQGGTITLTNHGVSGSLFATPVINQPQSAIVGVGAVKKRVVVIEETDSIAVRPMMFATLTFDHRVADGAIGDAFLRTFVQTLEQWQ